MYTTQGLQIFKDKHHSGSTGYSHQKHNMSLESNLQPLLIIHLGSCTQGVSFLMFHLGSYTHRTYFVSLLNGQKSRDVKK